MTESYVDTLLSVTFIFAPEIFIPDLCGTKPAPENGADLWCQFQECVSWVSIIIVCDLKLLVQPTQDGHPASKGPASAISKSLLIDKFTFRIGIV